MAISQEAFKSLQTSFHEMLVPLNASLCLLTEQIKWLNGKMDEIQKQLLDNQEQMLEMTQF